MKKTHCSCWLILFLLTTQWSTAQTPKIDSLKKELVRNSVSNRFDVLWGLAYELFDVDNPQAVGYAREAHQAALATGDTLNIVMSGRILGQLLRRVDKVNESIDILSFVLPISKRRKLNGETKKILTSLAGSYTFKGEYDKALESNLGCLMISENENDKKGIGTSFFNIGFLHYRLSNFDVALTYYLKALKIKEEINDNFDLNRLMVNVGLCYNYLENYNLAQEYFNRVFKLCESNCERLIIIECELGIANCFFKQKRYDEARSHYMESLHLSILENNKRFQIENLIDLVSISIIQGKLKEAKVNLDLIAPISELDQYQDLKLEVLKLLASYSELKKDFRSANFFRKEYTDLREMLFGVEQNKALIKLQMKLAERENLAKIESQSGILLLQQKTLRQRELLNVFIGIIAVLTIGWVIVLFRVNQQKQSINVLLNLRVKERTIELEGNRDELRNAHSMQALVLKRISDDSISHLATIKGLSSLACRESPEEQAIYFKQVERTIENLIFSISKYLPSDENKK